MSAQQDDKCREAFEAEYGVRPDARSPSGEYRVAYLQIAWTHFWYGWLAKERAQ